MIGCLIWKSTMLISSAKFWILGKRKQNDRRFLLYMHILWDFGLKRNIMNFVFVCFMSCITWAAIWTILRDLTSYLKFLKSVGRFYRKHKYYMQPTTTSTREAFCAVVICQLGDCQTIKPIYYLYTRATITIYHSSLSYATNSLLWYTKKKITV